MEKDLLTRYAEIPVKNKREIVLLRGSGCKWRRCTFCDYHLDYSLDEDNNYMLNQEVLQKVTGKYRRLEVINSGSFVDLDPKTFQLIIDTCLLKKITEIHFECHWMHREAVASLRDTLQAQGIHANIKIGVETFDAPYREHVLRKGIDETDPAKIASDFDEVCLLFGLEGQTETSMQSDINIMVENTTPVKPCPRVIECFIKKLYPIYKENDRVDILLENTDFGVG